MKKILFLFLFFVGCTTDSPPVSISNAIKKKTNIPYSINALGGSGPGEKYETIIVSYTVDHYLELNNGRKEILELEQIYVDTINGNDAFLKAFVVPKVNRSNISLGLISSPYLKQKPWQITAIRTHTRSITYTTKVTINDDRNFYDYGKETYDEALKVAYGCGPFERVITYTKLGHRGVPLELHGPWGFFIQQAVIQQIQSGEFIYYAEINGGKCKLAVCGDQVVVEATGQPIRELFPPAPED